MLEFYRRFHHPQVISFDLDDTLYDNVPIMQRSEANVHKFLQQEFPATKGWQITDWQRLRQQIMREDASLASNMTLLRLATLERGLAQFEVADPKAGAKRALEVFLSSRSQLELSDEAHDLLRSLTKKYQVIAISNGNVEVPKTPLAEYFEHVFQPTENRRGKPHSDMFEAAMQAYPNVAPQGFLHVGDHPVSDVLGAHRAGWQSAWFKGGLGRASELKVLPNFAFGELAELQQILSR